jgi:hypothetical protein
LQDVYLIKNLEHVNYLSKAKPKKILLALSCFALFFICKENKLAKVLGAQKGIYIYLFFLTLPLT